MAQQVLPIIGAVVGGYFGGPSGAQAGWAIGAAVGGAVAASEPKPGPRLGELPVQTSYEGSPRAIIYGTATCTGYVLAFGPPIKTTEIETGDKGAPKSENEVVYRSYAIAICEGPIEAVLRVWENDKLVYDVRPESMMVAESMKWLNSGGGTRFYLGGEEQVPDIFMALNVSGLGETPGYSGTAYMFRLLADTTDTRGAIQQYRFEVARHAESGLGTLIVGPTLGHNTFLSADANGVAYAIDPLAETSQWATDESCGITRYNENLDPVATTNYTNVGDTEITQPAPIAASPDGKFLCRDGFGGLCCLMAGGSAFAYFKPTSGAAREWWYSPDFEYGGMAFFRGSFLYLGIRKSGSGPTSWNRICRFSTAMGNAGSLDPAGADAILPVASVTNVDPSGNSHFWMHVSRAGTVRAVTHDGSGKEWSEDLVTSAGTWALPPGAVIPNFAANFAGFGIDESLDLIAVVYVGTANIYKLSTGELLNSYSLGTSGATTRVIFTDDAVLIQRFRSFFRIGLLRASGLAMKLSDVVSEMHLRAGVYGDDYDVSELSGIDVKGLTLQSDGYTASDAISTLQSCYFFDKQEDGVLIKYPLRGKPVVTTLTIDDLVETPDLSKREQAGEIPRKVNLMYQNSLAGYAPVKATFEASSPDNKSTLEISTQVAVVLDVDEAQQMVHKVFKVAVSDAQGEIKLSVPDSFVYLCPGDCIGLSLRGRVIRLRIEEVEWADGVMNLTCRTDRQSAYTSVLTGIPIPEPTLPPSTIAGDTQFAYLDIPARIDSEDDLHYLVAGTSAMPGWYGWAPQRSLDGGLNFSSVATWNDRAVMGTLVDPVTAASEHYTDTTNTVRVQLYRTTQVIESQTEQQFLSEGGAFAIVRPDGSAEVMQYLDADDEGDGVFALTTLHRGLLNTGGSAHLEGALFVMLSSAKHVTAQSAWLGMDLMHRAVSLGESPETADIQTDTFVGRSQIEWPVAYLDAQRDLSDMLTVSWLPRHRFGSDVIPIASANFQGFRVTFDDGATSVSFDTTGTTYVYDASAMGSSVEVSVAPINRITGVGPAESVIA